MALIAKISIVRTSDTLISFAYMSRFGVCKDTLIENILNDRALKGDTPGNLFHLVLVVTEPSLPLLIWF